MINRLVDATGFDENAIHDIAVYVPPGSEDVLADQVARLGRSRIVMDPEDPEEFLYDENDCATVRVGRGVDPYGYARELARRVLGVQITGVFACEPLPENEAK